MIERANRESLHDLLGLLRLQFDEHDIPYQVDELISAIEAVLLNEELGLFILAKDGQLTIGFAAISFAWTLEHGGKSAWLDELFVLPSHRGQGIGSKLLEAVFEAANKTGCRAIDLEVEEEHHRAAHLYIRYGFKPLRRNRWVKSL